MCSSFQSIIIPFVCLVEPVNGSLTMKSAFSVNFLPRFFASALWNVQVCLALAFENSGSCSELSGHTLLLFTPLQFKTVLPKKKSFLSFMSSKLSGWRKCQKKIILSQRSLLLLWVIILCEWHYCCFFVPTICLLWVLADCLQNDAIFSPVC